MALPVLPANQAQNPPSNRRDHVLQPSNSSLLLLQAPGPSPDHHLDGVDADAQAPLLGDHVGNPATAVADLRVKVHPLPRRWLGHDVDVHLGTARLCHPQQDKLSTGTSHPSPFGWQRGWSCSHPLHFIDLGWAAPRHQGLERRWGGPRQELFLVGGTHKSDQENLART